MAHLAVLSTPPAVDTVMMPLVDVAATIGKVGAKPSKDALKAATTHAPEETLSSKERDSLLKQLNKTLEAFDTHVSLTLDDKSHQTVIKVIDNNTGKVVRQIPSEQLMRVSERITELLGVIYDKKM
jgi:flagellar protein FlaG